jgi:hypothetical protein
MRGPCDELLEDLETGPRAGVSRSSTNGGDAGKGDKPGGPDWSIVVEVLCKRQHAGGAVHTTEDTSLGRLRMLVELA